MAKKDTNPFVLPGIGQFGDTAQNPLLASMEMMRTAWEGLSKVGGFDPALTAPGLSSDDLERRIADLRAVEQWLQMNLSMLASTIQALEVQRSTVATLNAFVASATQSGATTAPASPLDAVLGSHAARTAPSGDSSGLFGTPLGQAPNTDTPPSSQPGSTTGSQSSADPGTPAGSDADNAVPTATQAAMQGWWDTLQTQFDSLAEATAATMKGAESMQEHMAAQASAAMPGGSSVAKKAAKKSASKKTTAKKAAARKATKATSARKTASPSAGASKTAAKKAAKRTTSTPAAKKTAAKKTGARKAAKSATGTE